jgi:predicted negative regulator of RcsB-dependent stress response
MANSKDAELRHIARLRLARVLTALGKPDDAIKTLADDAWGAFAAQAHEVRGDAFYAKHDVKGAVKEYQAALGAGDAGGGDSALLQLKIADLSAPPSAPPPTADSSNKAKP